MTQTSQNSPGTLVMYKLKEENIWWPAILYSSHTLAQLFMTRDNFSSDYHKEILQQYFKELNPENPRKPVVCVLGHPIKPAGKPWWYQINDAKETQPLTVSNINMYFDSTPEVFQDSLNNTLAGIVAEKMSSKEFRIANESPSGEAVPNVSPDTARRSPKAVRASQHDLAASSLETDKTNHQTKKQIDTPTHSEPPHDKKMDSSVNTDTSDNEPMPMEATIETAPFDIHASFAVAWDKLEDQGWYEHRSNKDWNMYYTQPHELGGRHFLRHEIEAYLRDTYGWNPSDDSDDERRSVVTTPDCRTKPQDPGQPLPESPEVPDVVLNASTLEKEGWKVVKGGILQNYLYLRPGVKKGEGREGVDYFTNIEDALNSYIAEVEDDTRSFHSKPSVADTQPRRLDLDDEISNDEPYSQEESSRKSAKKKTPSSSHRKASDASTTSRQDQKRSKSKDRKPKNVEAGKKIVTNAQKGKKRSGQTATTTGSLQRSDSVPTPFDIISLLPKIGFQLIDQKTLSFNLSESEAFRISMVGLPVFLARYGVPNAHKLKTKELENIKSWIRFAHIPKAKRSQLRNSENLSSEEILDILRRLGFEIFSGTVYIPNCPHNERIHGIHYFREDRLQSEFRSFLGWALDYASMVKAYDSDDDDDEAQRPVDHLFFVSKLKVDTPDHDLYTKLRLWAASQNAPLPSFSVRKLDHNFIAALVDPEIRVSVANVTKHSSSLAEIPSNEDEERPPSRFTKQPRQPNGEKLKYSPPAWHQMYVGGKSNSAVLEFLGKLGFQEEGNAIIFHPSIGERRFSLEEVRRYMVQNHIVDFEKKKSELDKSNLQTLHRWCTYVNLDHEVFMPYLAKAKLLADEKVVKILQKLGFGCVSGDYYLPGADRNRLTRRSFSLSQLFEYCRSHEVWSINDMEEVGIHSYTKFDVGLSDWVDMLLTMARVDEQILAFKTPSKLLGRSKRRREILEDMDIQELFLAPEKKVKQQKRSLDSRPGESKKSEENTDLSDKNECNDENSSKAEPAVPEIKLQTYCDGVSMEMDKEQDPYSKIDGSQPDIAEIQNEQEITSKTDLSEHNEPVSEHQAQCEGVSVTTNLDLEECRHPKVDGTRADATEIQNEQKAVRETSPSEPIAPAADSTSISQSAVPETEVQMQCEDFSMGNDLEMEQSRFFEIGSPEVQNHPESLSFVDESDVESFFDTEERADPYTQD